MCVFMHDANADNTKGYIGQQLIHGLGIRHVLAYQNRVMNLNNDGPNAMILHVPAKDILTSGSFVGTRSCPNFLGDMERAITPSTRNAKSLSSGAVNIFSYDIYSVVSTDDALLIPEALNSDFIPKDKRPKLTPHLFSWYARTFPGYKFVVLCFNNREAETATPILLHYDPLHPYVLEFPAIDMHRGDIPDLGVKVRVNHTIFLSTIAMTGGSVVRYSDNMEPNTRRFLPDRVVGKSYKDMMPNGDFTYSIYYADMGMMDSPGFNRSHPI